MCHTLKEAVAHSAFCWLRVVRPDAAGLIPEHSARPRHSWGKRSWVGLTKAAAKAAAAGEAPRAEALEDLARDLFRAQAPICGTDPRFKGLWTEAKARALSWSD